jgi:uncharacterized protein with FMN-binding domain
VIPREDESGNGRSSRWLKSNLVALGSAAVLAVYSAGYARTRTAAERFADESRGRRAPERPSAEGAPFAVVPHTDTVAAAPPPTANDAKSAVEPVPERIASASSTATSKTDKIARPTVATDTVPAATKIADSTPPVIAPKAPIANAPLPAPSATSPVDSAKTADTAHVQLKDGTFAGWGTSRHGDVEAAVQIKDGRIVSAFIVQCLTQYSCSWISALPPQVVTRQSAEVDYVSGATQSSNAFYYAIVEALSKAK